MDKLSAKDVIGMTFEEVYPIIKEILKDMKDNDFATGDLINRIAEDDRLSLKGKIMAGHFIGTRR